MHPEGHGEEAVFCCEDEAVPGVPAADRRLVLAPSPGGEPLGAIEEVEDLLDALRVRHVW